MTLLERDAVLDAIGCLSLHCLDRVATACSQNHGRFAFLRA